MKIFFNAWQLLTKDEKIRSWVKGYKIPFIKNPCQYRYVNKKLLEGEIKQMTPIISDLLKKGIISNCIRSKTHFFSSFFLVPKSDGTSRFILNLKGLNRFISPPHFKLDNYKSVKDLITKKCYMATIDLKDAYYMVPIYKKHRQFLSFKFNNQVYQFNCLPMGLATAPYVFTKLLKPVFNFFRRQGILCLIYLDDILILGSSYTEVKHNVAIVLKTLQELGFIINWKKSQLIPSQICEYLGFIYNSCNMTMYISDDKKETIIKKINTFCKKENCKIREFSRIIGILISICPAVQYGWFHMKILEREKYVALKKSDGYYDSNMYISKAMRDEFFWWKQNITQSFSSIECQKYVYEIYTDASRTGWGAAYNDKVTRGFWNKKEARYHINYLELLAILYAIQCFASEARNCNILLRVDNKTAIAYINKMGGIRHQSLNRVAREIWTWCEDRKLMLYATYIASNENIVADKQSRIVSIEAEYSLNNKIYSNIVSKFGKPEIDLFASRINKKCDNYVSWMRDPGALTSNAFTLTWDKSLRFYAFPPFPIIGRVLKKIIEDKGEGIIVVPYWPNQPWFSLFLRLSIAKPITFKPDKNLLLSPFSTSHPVWKNIPLAVSKLSGDLF